MIGATKRLLIDTLSSLAHGENIEIECDGLSDHIRALFLIASSHSIETLPLAERISYQEYEEDRTGTPTTVKGVAVTESGMLLTDVIEDLMELSELPKGLTESVPDLTHEDFTAALFAIRCILYSLQQHGWDEHHEKRYSQEKAQRVIRSSLKSLQSYRETGEP